MRWLIALLIMVLAVGDVLGLDMSLAPGLSVKNAFVYVVAVALLFRIVLEGESRLDLAIVHAWFVVLIGYAILTWLLAALVIEYRRYDLVDSAILLKAELLDAAVFFFACFHGVRNQRDIGVVLRAITLAVIAGNAVAITDVLGWTDFGLKVGERGEEAGRVFGTFGHANETATLIASMLPAMVGLAVLAHGVRKWVWIVGALVSAAVLLMTVSRGAYVGVVLGSALAAWLCRDVIPLRRVAAWAFAAVWVVALLVVAVSGLVGDVLTERVLGSSGVIDVGTASSGRTDIWWALIERMMSTPVTLLTGYGWATYSTMPFRYAPHNHYLGLWFELGLVGLLAYVAIIVTCVRRARSALRSAGPQIRPLLVAFIFGISCLSVILVFAELTTPWLYIWAYIGVSMRATLIAASEPAEGRAPRPAQIPASWVHPVAARRPAIFDRRQ